MNERIRELAREAGLNLIHDNFMTASQEKFAQLIIDNATECVRDVLRDENSELTYAACDQVQQRIRQHFGVEDRAVPILSADEQALFAGIALSESFTIEGVNKAFGVEP